MRNEIIYASSAKILILEKSPPFFKANLSGKVIEIKKIEPLGITFPLTVYPILKDKNSAKKKLEMMFQDLQKTNPLGGSLECYLSQAGIPFTLGRKEEGKPQYLGLSYETDIKENTIFCQFYLIKDDLKL
ncbi:MAG: hypothetical protein NTZ83_00230 [Candidatus Pacearchaeota archaeon]|nr:hypothetical protein [Candidatus Pacearchaeota archaeon]